MKRPWWQAIFLSWYALAVYAFLLCLVTWPWQNHWVAYFWGGITLATLLGELGNKLFSPKKQTVSNNIQDELEEDPVRFWAMIIIWFLFAVSLIGHFCLKGM